MDIQKITLNVNNSKETVQTLHIIGGEHGNGMQGRAVHIHAQPNVTYQLIDDATHLGPENIVVKRDGQNLLISFKGGNLQHPDLVIDDYYKPNGELGYNAGSNNLLLGQASNGHFYAYIPESGQGHDAVSILANEVSAGQVLGGADHASSPWWQADVASANIPTTGNEATPLLPVNTEPTNNVPTPIMAHADHNTQAPASADNTPGIGADGTNIENSSSGFELFSAFVAAATAGSIYEAHVDDGKTIVDSSTTTPTPTPPVTTMPYTFDANSGVLSIHDNSPLDYSQLHDVKTIDLDDSATAQDLSISAKNVMDITPSADHTLYITSTDTNDHVTLDSGFTADTSADKDMNGVHFKAYTDSTQPDVHLFVQDGLLAATTVPTSPAMPYTFDSTSGTLTLHDANPVDFTQLHDVKTITMDDDSLAQPLTITAKDVMDITPSTDHTLYIHSNDVNDKVTLGSQLTANTSADTDMGGVHYSAYVDSTQPDLHLFVQTTLIA